MTVRASSAKRPMTNQVVRRRNLSQEFDSTIVSQPMEKDKMSFKSMPYRSVKSIAHLATPGKYINKYGPVKIADSVYKPNYDEVSGRFKTVQFNTTRSDMVSNQVQYYRHIQ